MPGTPPLSSAASRRAPLNLFLLELAYLVGLIALFVVYEEVDGLRDALPGSFGSLPMPTVWFGAVGAVLAGLGGQFFHHNDWDPSYNRWHVSRPLLGAVEGPIGCLLLLVTVRAASKQTPTPDAAFYDAAAFLVGFAEKTFRDLITKATQVIIGPGDTGPPAGAPKAPPDPSSSGSPEQ